VSYRGLAQKMLNPPHGSAGIVQIRPTLDVVLKYPNPTQRQLVDCSSPAFRSDATMETATLLEVLGSVQTVRKFVESRLELNNPPTAVGWDSDTSKLRPE